MTRAVSSESEVVIGAQADAGYPEVFVRHQRFGDLAFTFPYSASPDAASATQKASIGQSLFAHAICELVLFEVVSLVC